MTEAEALYLDRIAEDCARLLRPAGRVERLDVESNDHVALRLVYRIGQAVGTSEGRGDSLVAAHADLIERVSRDWLSVVRSRPRPADSHRLVRLGISVLMMVIGLALILLGPSIILFISNTNV